MEYEQKEYLALHLILSSTSAHLSQKLLYLTTVKAMWDDVKLNVTAKSLFHQIDILNRLQTMKYSSSLDLKTHLSEVKSHFEKMTQLREHLQVMNSPISDSTYVSIIISSMPETYHPTIQTVETTMGVMGK
jgi:chloramphenicol O-acetyltransferase